MIWLASYSCYINNQKVQGQYCYHDDLNSQAYMGSSVAFHSSERMHLYLVRAHEHVYSFMAKCCDYVPNRYLYNSILGDIFEV